MIESVQKLDEIEKNMEKISTEYFYEKTFCINMRKLDEGRDGLLFEVCDKGTSWRHKLFWTFTLSVAILIAKVIPSLWMSCSGLCLVVGIAYLFRQSTVRSEYLLVVPSQGIQIFRKTFGGKIFDVNFYERSKIKKILINEAFSIFQVVSYIVMELTDISTPPDVPSGRYKNDPLGDLVLPFKHFRLPLTFCVDIVKEIHEHLD